MTDVPEIHKLINFWAAKDEMLPKSLIAIYENLRDFYVADEDTKILGCCALHISWDDLAEIKSLAVDETAQGIGLGKKLAQSCIYEAKELGIPRLFALTYVPEFFIKLGFHKIENASLPHKIWSECIYCPKFPNCGEIAVELRL
jgi:amino-acid N-acetyltransferase